MQTSHLSRGLFLTAACAALEKNAKRLWKSELPDIHITIVLRVLRDALVFNSFFIEDIIYL